MNTRERVIAGTRNHDNRSTPRHIHNKQTARQLTEERSVSRRRTESFQTDCLSKDTTPCSRTVTTSRIRQQQTRPNVQYSTRAASQSPVMSSDTTHGQHDAALDRACSMNSLKSRQAAECRRQAARQSVVMEAKRPASPHRITTARRNDRCANTHVTAVRVPRLEGRVPERRFPFKDTLLR